MSTEKLLPSKTRYVAGFLFNNDESFVALMLKARPDWQKGKLNAIGGHIEVGETPHDAIAREWKEETDSDAIDWTLFTVLSGNNFEVYFFRGNGDLSTLESYSEGEEIVIVSVKELPENVVSNLHWLVPAASVKSSHDWPYRIEEKAILIATRASVSGLREKVESAKRIVNVTMTKKTMDESIGYNQALDNVLSLLSDTGEQRDVLGKPGCNHSWEDVDDEIGGNRTTVFCDICKIYGERNDETGHIHFPIS